MVVHRLDSLASPLALAPQSDLSLQAAMLQDFASSARLQPDRNLVAEGQNCLLSVLDEPVWLGDILLQVLLAAAACSPQQQVIELPMLGQSPIFFRLAQGRLEVGLSFAEASLGCQVDGLPEPRPPVLLQLGEPLLPVLQLCLLCLGPVCLGHLLGLLHCLLQVQPKLPQEVKSGQGVALGLFCFSPGLRLQDQLSAVVCSAQVPPLARQPAAFAFVLQPDHWSAAASLPGSEFAWLALLHEGCQLVFPGQPGSDCLETGASLPGHVLFCLFQALALPELQPVRPVQLLLV